MRVRKKRHPEVSLDATNELDEEDSRPLIEPGGRDLRLSGVLDDVNKESVSQHSLTAMRLMFWNLLRFSEGISVGHGSVAHSELSRHVLHQREPRNNVDMTQRRIRHAEV
jgi:hypothetical protein